MNRLKNENGDWWSWLGKRVCVKDKFFGTLKYFGTTQFSDGLWCGIELDEPVGKNNGTAFGIPYFKCKPSFGIFVPVSKVRKMENTPKNLTQSIYLNGTFEVQNSREKTFVLSNSDDLLSNKEVCNVKKSETSNKSKDSEESLGLLDPNLYDSFDSLDFRSLDAACNAAPNFENSILGLDKQKKDFPDSFSPVQNNLFSNEISSPIYASTPRHPGKRFTVLSDTDSIRLPLQNVIEDDVFSEEINFARDVFFDNEKLKNNPTLTSTSEIHRLINMTSSANVNPKSRTIDLNKTQVIPFSSISDHKIVPVSMDLNKTQTFQNKCETSDTGVDLLSTTFKMSTKTKNEYLNLTGSLQTGEILENCRVETAANEILEIECLENIDLNSTVSQQDLSLPGSCQQSCQVEAINDTVTENDYTEFKNLNKTVSLEIMEDSENVKKLCQDKAAAVKILEVDCLKTIDLNSTINLQDLNLPIDGSGSYQLSCQVFATADTVSGNDCTELNKTVCLEIKDDSKNIKFCQVGGIKSDNVSGTDPTENKELKLKANNADKKAVAKKADRKVGEFKRPLPIPSSISKLRAPFNVPPTVSKENDSDSKKRVSLHLVKPHVSKVINKNYSVNIKSVKQEKDIKNFNSFEKKSAFPRKSLVSDINFNSVKAKNEGRVSSFDLSTRCNGQTTESGCFRRFSYSQNAETTRLSNTTGSLPLQNQDNGILQRSIKIKLSPKVLPVNNVNGDNASEVSLSNPKKIVSKTGDRVKNPLVFQLKEQTTKNKVPISQLSLNLSSDERRIPRHSLTASSKTRLPTGIIKPRSRIHASGERNIGEAKNDAILKGVPLVSHQAAEVPSNKATRIASSLPQKRQIATIRMGQKHSDVKVESGGSPKIPRYNLREKK